MIKALAKDAVALLAVCLTAVAVQSSESDAVHVPLGLDEFIPIPEENPRTAAKVELGRQLFFDKRLSRDNTVACATCHVPERAFTDGKRVAVGIEGRFGRRNALSLFNRSYGRSFFWDGRAKALEEQPLEAIFNPKEMDLTLEELDKRLNELNELNRLSREGATKSYRERFEEVFDERPTAQNVAKAIATFVRTLLSGNSPFDRFEHGDASALSDAAKRGLQIFRGKGNCIACHSGPLLSDEDFHNTGVSWGKEPVDLGNFEVTKKDADRGKFKTPSLRNVALTAPYMHDGSLATLEDVIELYNRGGQPNPNLDRELRPLGLTAEEKRDLAEFLASLSGTDSVASSPH